MKKMNYVPVGTGGEMLPLVMSGKVTVATGGLNEVAGQFKAGKLRPIGISSPERLPRSGYSDLQEQGVDATLVNWRGLMAPPAVSAKDKQSLEEAVAKMVQSALESFYKSGNGFLHAIRPVHRLPRGRADAHRLS